ncbi:zf-RING_2 domain-containing protein [Cephalotus follicularis]|uniref:RING-type E3 ubiquitin transferase n=1 Tax=Cephalotus follicularis TaxID=3775 RepID=A0A1Q3C165_CEPFO|nr:zf-RING_2 domain-containing protein [Cephalotus follicularis]
MESEEALKQELEELQKQLGKKQSLEEALSSIKSLLQTHYHSASPSLQNSFYSVVCRVATVLRTRHTAPGFWLGGLQLFQLAASLVSIPSHKQHLISCIAQAKEHLDPPPTITASAPNRGYLFEGHLTVDPEPDQPRWLVMQQNVMNVLATTTSTAESSRVAPVGGEDDANEFQYLIDDITNLLPDIITPRAPPAGKEVIAKLPLITLTNEILAKLGQDAECAICKENLVVGDEMQELPCKHTFHPPCLKPWLDAHNSCPVCRYELETDDHAYESWKERKKEDEEERKGAANAVRGGEYMYV